ncbi:hypothetical protein [Mycolicibacterium austroafricanum]|uniref:hypothetical protein n=1 Tax=Mycolicibacterium austroafricanum TaxID=39687 RepID=UPI000560926C|nr:hypothetical protein [Mycolicibacterium austroafricanum]
MYTLTINDHGCDVTTLHDTPTAAQAALNRARRLGSDCRLQQRAPMVRFTGSTPCVAGVDLSV